MRDDSRLTSPRAASRLLTISAGWSNGTQDAAREVVLSPAEIKRLFRSGGVLRHLLRYRAARITVDDLDAILAPTALFALRAFSRGACWIEDRLGRRRDLGWLHLAGTLGDVAQTLAQAPTLLRRVDSDLDRLEAAIARAGKSTLDLRHPPIYLRTDLCFGLRAGGSVAHTAGVLNELPGFAPPPLFVCPDRLPMVRPDIETVLIRPLYRRWLRSEWALLDFNARFLSEAEKLLATRPASFLYHRYSLHSYAAASLSLRTGTPLVLEYNGPEIWVARHWGNGLVEPRRAERIELLNLRAARLITVVSEPLREQLISRGIDPAKILVNPNGVDPDRYSPEIDGTAVRRRLGLDDGLVIGFLGTFGPWHGAEVLADAFTRLLASEEMRRLNPRLLLVGDGVRRGKVEEILRGAQVEEHVVMTGLVPQEEAPPYLTACDILVAPHVPNPDGSAFFGSPTKLFEYMAMGKAIVASNLGQIGEILESGRTALLVPPGEPEPLAAALGTLGHAPELRRRLGAAAREAVLRNFTWKHHVARLFDRLAAFDS